MKEFLVIMQLVLLTIQLACLTVGIKHIIKYGQLTPYMIVASAMFIPVIILGYIARSI